MPVTATPAIVAELAPTGVLKAGINLSNFLLVTGKSPTGDPVGVGPDMARAIADRLAERFLGIVRATIKGSVVVGLVRVRPGVDRAAAWSIPPGRACPRFRGRRRELWCGSILAAA